MVKIKQNCQIILASNSLPRKKILSDLGLSFEVMSPKFDEDSAKKDIQNLNIENQALYLAKQKALSISKDYPEFLVIGSDQICELNKKPVNKSSNKTSAIAQLKMMRGKTHYQNNATCLYQGKKLLFKNYSRAKLIVRNLSDKEIANYVNIDKSWGCAGSYKFESLGKHLFSKVEGCDYSIIGMDILPIINFLHKQKLITL
jgi:septum formation protein